MHRNAGIKSQLLAGLGPAAVAGNPAPGGTLGGANNGAACGGIGGGLCALQHPPQMWYEMPPPSVLHMPPPHTAKAGRALPVLRMLPACSSCTSHGARACARAYSYCWKAPRRPACRRSPRAPPASLGTRMCEMPARARLKLSAQLLPQMQGTWG